MDGELTREGATYTVRFERVLAHPPEKVWRALTEPDLLRQWFPDQVEGEWKVGAPLHFGFEQPIEGMEGMDGVVLAVQAPKLLEFTWGSSTLRCELRPEGAGCRLVFSETFEDGSIAARDAAGWEMCLENLVAVLEGRLPEEFELGAWRVPFAKYVARFEAVAGPQVGPPGEG